jgi:hypothetical protein
VRVRVHMQTLLVPIVCFCFPRCCDLRATLTRRVRLSSPSPYPDSAEATTRSKLAALDGKLSKLERRMDTVEATLHSVDQGQGS